jgi:ribosomal protein L37E
MRYTAAIIITAALTAGWTLALRDILQARRRTRARTAARSLLDALPPTGPADERHQPPRTLYQPDPDRLAALRQIRDERRSERLNAPLPAQKPPTWPEGRQANPIASTGRTEPRGVEGACPQCGQNLLSARTGRCWGCGYATPDPGLPAGN